MCVRARVSASVSCLPSGASDGQTPQRLSWSVSRGAPQHEAFCFRAKKEEGGMGRGGAGSSEEGRNGSGYTASGYARTNGMPCIDGMNALHSWHEETCIDGMPCIDGMNGLHRLDGMNALHGWHECLWLRAQGNYS